MAQRIGKAVSTVYYPVYLPENTKELVKYFATTLYHLDTKYGVQPDKMLVDPEGWERLQNAAKFSDKRQWDLGRFQGVEIFLMDANENKVCYLSWVEEKFVL